MHGVDEEGLERIFRLFPMRTGMPCPEWMIVDKRADSFSFGGILGAGYVPQRSEVAEIAYNSFD